MGVPFEIDRLEALTVGMVTLVTIVENREPDERIAKCIRKRPLRADLDEPVIDINRVIWNIPKWPG